MVGILRRRRRKTKGIPIITFFPRGEAETPFSDAFLRGSRRKRRR